MIKKMYRRFEKNLEDYMEEIKSLNMLNYELLDGGE